MANVVTTTRTSFCGKTIGWLLAVTAVDTTGLTTTVGDDRTLSAEHTDGMRSRRAAASQTCLIEILQCSGRTRPSNQCDMPRRVPREPIRSTGHLTKSRRLVHLLHHA